MNRTLVCVLAESRMHRLTWSKFKKNLLDSIGADLALCISVTGDYDYANPFWQHATYKWCVPDYTDWGEAFDKAQAWELKKAGIGVAPDWRRLKEIKNQWLGGVRGEGEHPGSAGILLYFRWELLQHLTQENIFDKYDRVVVTRSDFMWEVPHPSMAVLDEDAIWVPDGEGYGGVTDRHAVLSRHNYQDYLGILGPMVTDPDGLYAKMQIDASWNLEKYIAFNLLSYSRRHALRYFPHAMFSVREWGGATKWAQGEWSDELGFYIKYRNEYAAATSLKSVVMKSADWNDILFGSSERGFNAWLEDANGRSFAAREQGFIATDEPLVADQPDIRLFIDYADGHGRVYAGRSTLGECGRQQMIEVEVSPVGNGLFRITGNNGATTLCVDAEGKLCVVPVGQSDHLFRIRCRFEAGGLDNNLIRYGAEAPALKVVASYGAREELAIAV